MPINSAENLELSELDALYFRYCEVAAEMRPGFQMIGYEFRRGRLVELGFFVIALIVAFAAARVIVANDLASLAIGTMAVVVFAVVVITLHDWRHGLYLFLAWLLLEDMARKYLGNNMAIYFAKDFLVAVVYISFFLSRRSRDKDAERFRPPFRVALFVFVWYGIIQVFNPLSAHIAYGILGAKLYLYYIPLLVIGYYLLNSETELRTFFHINLTLMLVIAVLGMVQSILGPRFLNPEVMADDIRLLSETYRVAPISGAIVYRPTSVFVSTARFADLLIVAWILVFGFSGYLILRHRRGRIFAFVALAVTAASCLMCASRGAFMWVLGSSVVGSAAFVWGAPWRQGEALRVVRTLQRALLGVALAIVALLLTYPDAFLGRLAVYSETLDPRSSSSELLHRTRDYPLANFLAAFDYQQWPYGYGIGAISNGGQYVSRFFHVRPVVGSVESGFGCIIIEMGIGGLILWNVMALSVLLYAWKIVRGLKGTPWFPLAFMIFLYVFLLFLPMTFTSMTSYHDFVLNAYVWLLLGVLFRLPKLALTAQLEPGFHDQQTGNRRAP